MTNCILKKTTIVVLSLLVFLIFTNNGFSMTEDELKQKIDATTASKKVLEDEIAQYQAQIKDIGDQANTLANTLKTLTTNEKKINAQISLTKKNIEIKNLFNIFAKRDKGKSSDKKNIYRFQKLFSKDSLFL